jgi:hypothetical protein
MDIEFEGLIYRILYYTRFSFGLFSFIRLQNLAQVINEFLLE